MVIDTSTVSTPSSSSSSSSTAPEGNRKLTETDLIGVLELLPDGRLWNIKRKRIIKPSPVGGGYLAFGLMGRKWSVHRVIWALTYGPIPEGMIIDHINRDRMDNAIDNLRLATRCQNGRNRTANPNKASGLPKGVYFDCSKFVYKGIVEANGKRSTKNFHCLEDAIEWTQAKRRELHGEFYCD